QGEEKADDDPVHEQRGSAVADERQRDPRQRDQLEVAGCDDERLRADDEGEARGEERPELVGRGGGDPQAALHDDEEQPEDRHDPDQPQLLAQRGEWEVRVDRRDREAAVHGRQPGTESGSQQAAATEGEQRLDDLVAVAGRVAERVSPDVDAGLDRRDEEVHHVRAGEEQEDTHDDVPDPPGRDVEERQEDGEEQQGGPQVALHDDDAEGDRPHRGHRREERQRRQRDRADLGRLFDEQGPVLREVAGEEDHEDHLQQLGRLAADRADRQAQPLAVDVVAEEEGRQEQRDAGGGPGVLVEPEPAVAPDGHRERRREPERQDEPGELDVPEPQLPRPDRLDDLGLRQPLHEQEADPAEHAGRRQEDLVHAPSGQDQDQVGDPQQPEIDRDVERVRQAEPVGFAGVGDLARQGERDAADYQRRGNDREQPRL